MKITIRPDDYCFGDPWGETTCPEIKDEDECKDIEGCLECKKRRIIEIIKSIEIDCKKQ